MQKMTGAIAALSVACLIGLGCDPEANDGAKTETQPATGEAENAVAAKTPEDLAAELKVQATTELLREQVVVVNEGLIRDGTADLDEDATETFINATVNELVQCSAFRVAQAISLKNNGAGEKAVTFEKRAVTLETHAYLFAQATGAVFGRPALEDEVRQDLKIKAQSLVEQHGQNMAADRTPEQGQQHDETEARCRQTEEALKNTIETKARQQITSEAVDRRVQQLSEVSAATP